MSWNYKRIEMEFRLVIVGVVKNWNGGTSLAFQWLRLLTSNVGSSGSIPGQGMKIPHAAKAAERIKDWCGERKMKVAIQGLHEASLAWWNGFASWPYQCQYSGCDIVLQFYSTLPLWKNEVKSMWDLFVYLFLFFPLYYFLQLYMNL